MEEKVRKGRGVQETLQDKISKYSKGGTKEYFYIYNINIDQRCVIENEWWDLDIIDLCIFYAIYNFINVGKPKKFIDSKVWYWVEDSKILNDLPLLPISSEVAVHSRINKLIKYGLIERNPDNNRIRVPYLRIGDNAEKLFYAKVNPIL